MLKKILIAISLLLVLGIGLSFTPLFAQLRNFALWGKHSIHDYKTHPTRIVASGNTPQFWPLDSNYNKGVIPDSLMKIIDSNDTHAFLVFQDGKLLYEKYWDGYTPKTLSGSFSAAKSMISLLIGIALEEGKYINGSTVGADQQRLISKPILVSSRKTFCSQLFSI